MTILTQTEADRLLAIDKASENEVGEQYPNVGGKLQVPVVAVLGNETFFLNVTRSRTQTMKVSYLTRDRTVVLLARLDFGPNHRNPDDKIVGSPHLHLYKEGMGDRWAYELDALPSGLSFSRPTDLGDTRAWFDAFLDFCRIQHDNIVDWSIRELL